ncbi:MHYT domain-containing protein [Streptomyces sp. NPDC058045]|uniref:MHYT domain-containing protein n=1 Tax=Streptomyces sp. NPDC058045 TaxID=3346311 RepID=UPI0036E217E8
MEATTNGFSYGLVTPVVAFVMACLGGALGLRCVTRSLSTVRPWRAGWLALASAAIGSGVWTTHFVAMMGFTIEHAALGYSTAVIYASLGAAVLMVGAGVFVVGYQGLTGRSLLTGGTITGLGIASMHYLGMAGMRLDGLVEYNTLTVTASVAIAVVASVGALWAAVRGGGLLWSLGASVIMGSAVVGMHYVGMAAMHVKLAHPAHGTVADSPARTLAPLLIGPAILLLLAGVVVLCDPFLVAGRRRRPEPAGIPAPAARGDRADLLPRGGAAAAVPTQRGTGGQVPSGVPAPEPSRSAP